mmetsp:Transcript_100420/g.318941  ORF Transcript_100420/g.318941 Transcript_100420/m.318941 type:complete len:588 (-) Transcript_100420:47-1810(-)
MRPSSAFRRRRCWAPDRSSAAAASSQEPGLKSRCSAPGRGCWASASTGRRSSQGKQPRWPASDLGAMTVPKPQPAASAASQATAAPSCRHRTSGARRVQGSTGTATSKRACLVAFTWPAMARACSRAVKSARRSACAPLRRSTPALAAAPAPEASAAAAAAPEAESAAAAPPASPKASSSLPCTCWSTSAAVMLLSSGSPGAPGAASSCWGEPCGFFCPSLRPFWHCFRLLPLFEARQGPSASSLPTVCAWAGGGCAACEGTAPSSEPSRAAGHAGSSSATPDSSSGRQGGACACRAMKRLDTLTENWAAAAAQLPRRGAATPASGVRSADHPASASASCRSDGVEVPELSSPRACAGSLAGVPLWPAAGAPAWPAAALPVWPESTEPVWLLSDEEALLRCWDVSLAGVPRWPAPRTTARCSLPGAATSSARCRLPCPLLRPLLHLLPCSLLFPLQLLLLPRLLCPARCMRALLVLRPRLPGTTCRRPARCMAATAAKYSLRTRATSSIAAWRSDRGGDRAAAGADRWRLRAAGSSSRPSPAPAWSSMNVFFVYSDHDRGSPSRSSNRASKGRGGRLAAAIPALPPG